MGFSDGGGVGYHDNIASQDLVRSTTKLANFTGGLAGQVANYAINQQLSPGFLNSGFIMDALGIEDPGRWKTIENKDGTTSEV